MKQEDIKFLNDLQEELLTQDKLCQADPRFWVIKDYKLVVVPDDYAEDFRVYDSEGDPYTLKEFLKDIKENMYYYDYLDEFDLDDEDYENIRDIISLIEKKEKVSSWTLTGVMEEGFIVSDTMFLTNREAKDHLKSNYYHYTSKAHTYAMTAWRSPQVERLIQILQTVDFGGVVNEPPI